MKMEQTECSETSARKIQTPVNHPKERIQHSEDGESLKSRIIEFVSSYTGSIVVVFRPVCVAAKSAH
jgi:hypothetical protein